MLSKQQYLSKRKYANLSRAEKEKRWKAYLSSQRSARPVKRIARNSNGTSLEPCTREYAGSLVNPFESAPSCIPYPPAVPSQKLKLFVKSTFITSAGAVSGQHHGWCAWHPNIINDNSTANRYFVKETGAAYDSSTFTSATDTTGVSERNSTSPYASTDMGSSDTTTGIAWRVVSAGLRARYIGTELERGGRLVTLHHPDNQDIYGYSLAEVQSYQNCKTYPITRDWVAVTYYPNAPGQYDYSNLASHGGFASGAYPLMIGVVAPSETQLTFEYQCFMNVEIIGSKAPAKTPTPARMESTSDVVSAVADLQMGVSRSSSKMASPESSKAIDYVYNLALEFGQDPNAAVGRMEGMIDTFSRMYTAARGATKMMGLF